MQPRLTDTVIRPERPSDYAAIRTVVVAAFESAAEANLVDDIRASEGFIPELALIAEMDGEIVGHTMISRVGLVDGHVRQEIHSLAPVAIAPNFQGRGIGGQLIRTATAKADAMGLPLVVLEGSPTYYRRFGFEYSVPRGVHFDLPGWAPPEAGQLLRLPAYDPSIQGKVVYPPAFEGGGHN